MRKLLFILVMSGILLTSIISSQANSQLPVICGGDSELLIGCLGDEELTFLTGNETLATPPLGGGESGGGEVTITEEVADVFSSIASFIGIRVESITYLMSLTIIILVVIISILVSRRKKENEKKDL